MPATTTPSATRTALLTVGLLAVAITLWTLRDVLMLVGFAALIAYVLDPVVIAIERIRMRGTGPSRRFAAAAVMLLLVVGGGLTLAFAIPRLISEVSDLLQRLPTALQRLVATINYMAAHNPTIDALKPDNRPLIDLETLLSEAGTLAVATLRGLVGNLGGVLGLALTPMLAYYLLAEADDVHTSAMGFVPAAAQSRVGEILSEVDRALRSYVRGQAVVCAIVGGAVAIAAWLIGLPVPLLLGALAGVAEIVPILGFWSAAVVIVIAGFSVDPSHALWGVIAYVGINQLAGQFVTPQVMGRHMKMHPFVILVSILAGGAMLGAGGAVLALPLAAAVQSIVSNLAAHRGGARR
ncbi:MAG: AI-2E family transporter [Candidatus Eisenbacteria bacterium]|uniref:AI-2E family transporter n=1 Tax=Eiseniibacteriota bacterium TaxID=2212470 RepID=A0A849SNR7_UNCEI|nr:AI-2E family transporter [Candidatus Eisenbacteria bacterium]